ncbi:MAG: hypothetical protein M1817_000248 [Caeruleum heppii]|nr:MAG: hypothetical protein M1817_000248 [Caeruleum heppii]
MDEETTPFMINGWTAEALSKLPPSSTLASRGKSMAAPTRRRSTRASFQQIKHEAPVDHDTENASQDFPDADFAPQSSFAGKLQRYTYTRSSTSSNSPTTTAISRKVTTVTSGLSPRPAISSPLRASPKRKSSASSPSSLPKKRRSPSKYAPPTRYAHLPPLTDRLLPHLILLFIGVNPGLHTALTGHAYAHPSNLFWKLLYASGITPVRCRPEDDVDLPRRFGLGNTNIVGRATRDQGELGKREMEMCVGELEAKIRRWRPEGVCIVGKGIWEAVWRAKKGRAMKKEEFSWGWQDEGENLGRVPPGDDGGAIEVAEGVTPGTWEGARVFVATSTSGLAASLRPAEKEEIWRPLGEWVQRRRRERGWGVEEEQKQGDGAVKDQMVEEEIKIEDIVEGG